MIWTHGLNGTEFGSDRLLSKPDDQPNPMAQAEQHLNLGLHQFLDTADGWLGTVVQECYTPLHGSLRIGYSLL
jgi:hypothetical protein